MKDKIIEAYLSKKDIDIIDVSSDLAWAITGLKASKQQKLAAKYMYEGNAIEMPTGDGKTLAGLITILAWLKENKTITYITANDYLAKRDYDFMKDALESINKKILLFNTNVNDDDLKGADLIVSHGSEIVTRYLKDSVSKKEALITDHCLIDELDTVVIDESQEAIYLAEDLSYKKDLFSRVYKAVDEAEKAELNLRVVDNVLNKIGLNLEDYVANKDYIREMITGCVNATNIKKDIHYIVDNNNIILLDQNGRRTNKSFSSFVQLALELREGLEFSEPKKIISGISYETFLNKYSKKAGMSGTLEEERDFLSHHLNLELKVIDSEFGSRRFLKDDILSSNPVETLTMLYYEVSRYSKDNAPILIFSSSIEESEKIYGDLKKKYDNVTLLNAKNAKDEAEVISKTGRKNQITITTNMAGRGTDIVVDDDVRRKSGLVILATSHLSTKRLDRQLIGRTARRGDNGIVQFIRELNPEDPENRIILKFKDANMEKVKSLLNKTLDAKQDSEEKVKHDNRDMISCYYMLIDAQMSNIFQLKNAILYNEIEELIPSSITNTLPVVLKNGEKDKIRDAILERVINISIEHYSRLIGLMKKTSIFSFAKKDSFVEFQILAKKEYENLQDEINKAIYSSFAKGLKFI